MQKPVTVDSYVKARGTTKTELADALGISRQALRYRYVSGWKLSDFGEGAVMWESPMGKRIIEYKNDSVKA